VNNLPKVATGKRNGRDSNPRPFESQVQRSIHYATLGCGTGDKCPPRDFRVAEQVSGGILRAGAT